jgi:hypothetical protein
MQNNEQLVDMANCCSKQDELTISVHSKEARPHENQMNNEYGGGSAFGRT